METALYFPRIRVPETSWFTQVLLYWDSAAAIIPFEVLHGPDWNFSPYMNQLLDCRLVDAVDPYCDFRSDSFMEMIDQLPHDVISQPQAWTQLHASKMEADWYYFLQDRGLASPHRTSEWWDVEATTASLYMAYMAGYICGERDGYFPVTDTSDNVASLGPVGERTSVRLRALRYSVIMNALPVPSSSVPPRDLAAFKEKHCEKLNRLRTHLDAKLVDIAIGDDEEVRRVKTDNVLLEIQDEVAILKEEMTARRWPKIIFAGIGGVIGAALETASTVASGGSALVFGLGAGGGALTLGAAVPQLSELLRAPHFDQRRKPFVYAALASGL